MAIAYTVVGCQLGLLLVAATGKGICSVMLGDTQEELGGNLRSRFPGVEIVRDDDLLHSQAEALLCSIAEEKPHTDLALDVRGTPFQMLVWEELRRIPRGRTVTYGELAGKIGKPTACRAVARACATNPVAILTPCHRVIRANGKLGGYHWGIERKRRLLEVENSAAGHPGSGASP